MSEELPSINDFIEDKSNLPSVKQFIEGALPIQESFEEKKTKGTTNNFRRFMKMSPPILKIYFSTKASIEFGKKSV